MLGEQVVLAYDECPTQLSIVSLEGMETDLEEPRETPLLRDIRHKAHSTVRERANNVARPNRGPCCLASVDEARVLSGGYDSFVYLWTLSSDPDLAARSKKMPIEHSSAVSALAADLPTVYSAASREFVVTDTEKSKSVVRCTRSNDIFQIHRHPSNPKTVFLEVRPRPARCYRGHEWRYRLS